MPERVLSINRPRIVDEYIDGEAIMIDMTTGTYYSLNPAGTLVWRHIHGLVTVDSLVERAPEFFVDGVDEAPRVRDAVRAFIDELVAAELLVEGEQPSDDAGSDDDVAPLAFETPILETHTEMQDLMLLDPVHDVAPSGWPHVDPSSPGGGLARDGR